VRDLGGGGEHLLGYALAHAREKKGGGEDPVAREDKKVFSKNGEGHPRGRFQLAVERDRSRSRGCTRLVTAPVRSGWGGAVKLQARSSKSHLKERGHRSKQ